VTDKEQRLLEELREHQEKLETFNAKKVK